MGKAILQILFIALLLLPVTISGEAKKLPGDYYYLLEMMNSADVRDRRDAAAELGIYADDSAIPYLLKGLSDGDNKVRALSAESLGKIGTTEAIDPLLLLLDDASSSVRRSAIAALGEIGDPVALSGLIGALPLENDERARGAIVFSLGEIGTTEAVQPLIGALNDSDRWVRAGAAKALGKVGGTDARNALEDTAANDPEEVVRKFAKEALEDM